MAVADPIKGLREFLKADAGVTALAGTRVFAGELPRSLVDDFEADRVLSTVVLKPAGGGLLGTAFQEYGDIRVDVDCWGATPRDAWVLYLTVNAALKQLRHETYASCLLRWARPSSRGVSARDPDTDWPVCLSSWQVLAHEVEV